MRGAEPDMTLEVVKVEYLREPPPPPPDLYDEAIMRALLNMLAVCVDKEKARYDGPPDHAYHRLYAYMLTLAAMWKAKGLKPVLHLPSPAELDAELDAERNKEPEE